jgi:cathepsin L
MKILLVCMVLFVAGVYAKCREYNTWEEYKQHNDKTYSPEEDALRKEIWLKKHAQIVAHNSDASKNFELCHNALSDKTSEEMKALKGYLAPPQDEREDPSFFYDERLDRATAPNTIDWTLLNAVNPIKNQQQCGSCWAFSAISALESQWYLKYGVLPSLSEQQLVSCDTYCYGCQGGWNSKAYKYLMNATNGAQSDTAYPYTSMDGTSNGTCKVGVGIAPVQNYKKICSGNETDLQTAVGTIGPMSVCIDASHDSFQSYSSGVYNEKNCSASLIDHCVTAVGYGTDSASGLDYWIVRNQWGTTWGMKGYMWMVRNANNLCGIASQVAYPIV